MRITTQMLANSAAKSGIPIQRTSLLDIINNKSSQNLFKNISKSTDTTGNSATDILSDVNKMVEAYNATMKQLKTTGGTMNEFYLKQLKDIPVGSKEALESIGITRAKDGSLIVDEKIFRNADADILQKVLGGENGIAAKLSFLGEYISKNASENVVSASDRYGSDGATYMEAFEANKYNFFG